MPANRKTMYYEEKWIDGELCYRHSPNGEWEQFTKSQYRLRVLELERQQVNSVNSVDVIKSWADIREGDEFTVRCKVVKGKFELNLD